MYDVEVRNVIKQFPSGSKDVLAVDNVNLDIKQGEFFAMLGPSGCGKTTTLRMIAGFEQPTSGQILIRGQEMQHVPPFHRPVNTVFQDYALFPHMTILQNIMFGLEMDGLSKDACRQRAKEALEMVRLPDVGNRRPSQLSGGQQQRVALARALVKRPAVLLLDEPLGALDLKLRKDMQTELKTMQQQIGITFIYVTHDQEEAMTMADRIAVMDHGKVLQVGNPRQIYETPATRFVADFIGETNFIDGELVEIKGDVGTIKLSEDTTIRAQLPRNRAIHHGKVIVPIRPERIGLVSPEDVGDIPKMADMTVLEGRLVQQQYIGTDTRYTVAIAGGNEINVRVQNVDYDKPYDFDNGAAVKVFWPIESTNVLDE